MGRPTDFKPEYCQEAEKLCANGATDAELAEHFGVSDRTIYRWKASNPEFCQALKSGKDIADERVERSLYHRAVGYTYDAVHFSSYQGLVTATPYKEHVPPETTAAIFWLKNRRANEWRDKSEVHHRHSVEQMSDDELQRVAAGSSEGAAKAPVDSSQLN